MSKEKISISEIVDMIVDNKNIGKKTAEEFVKALLSTIEDALLNGETVKVKGMGAFKSVWNEARKSIDVNTGNEIIIPGYYKVTFSPENELRDAINEPFAHLETVELETEAVQAENETIIEKDIKETIEPIRIFEEQAEEIKSLLADIGAIPSIKELQTEMPEGEINDETPEKIPDELLPDEKTEETSEMVLPEEKPDEIEHQAIEEQLPTQTLAAIDSVQSSDDVQKEEKEENTDSELHPKSKTFDFTGFDIVRDLSLALADSHFAKKETYQEISEDIQLETPETTETETPQPFTVIDEDIQMKHADDHACINKDEIQETEVQIPVTENNNVESTGEEAAILIEKAPEHTDSLCVSQQQSDLRIEKVGEVKASEESFEHDSPANFDDKADLTFKGELSDDESAEMSEEVEENEKKNRSWLYVLIPLILIGGALAATWYLYPQLLKKKSVENKQSKMEHIADSVARIQAIADSLEKRNLQKDSISNKVAVPKKDSTAANNPANSQNIFDITRTYTETITTVEMKQGSQLSRFAKEYYGHPDFWVYIYEANKSAILDPNNVPVGVKLKIPKLDSRLIDPVNKECVNYAQKMQSKYLNN